MAVAPQASPAQPALAVSETAEQLYQEHSGWLYGYCLRVLRSPEEAEDAVQTTYLNACRGLNQGTRPRAGSAWLLRIAQNVCFSRLRSSGRRGKLESVQDITILEETVAAPHRSRDELIGLTDALVSMPENQRRAILLREWQGLSHREVAQELGLTQAAAETLIFRARRSLASALENPEKRSRLRSMHALDLGGILAAIKGFFAGSAGVKAVAAVAVAAATTATVAATDPTRVWRDGQAAAPKVQESQPAAGLRDIAETAHRSESAAANPRVRPNNHGQTTAAAAKAKVKAKGNNGKGKGTALAPGQAKKADPTPKGSHSRGASAGGRPDSPRQGGPPPHAQAKGHKKNAKP
jgi:RNA polymerase sigma factor (sigma-70 family)